MSVINGVDAIHHLSNNYLIINYDWLLRDLSNAPHHRRVSWAGNWSKALLKADGTNIGQDNMPESIRFKLRN